MWSLEVRKMGYTASKKEKFVLDGWRCNSAMFIYNYVSMMYKTFQLKQSKLNKTLSAGEDD